MRVLFPTDGSDQAGQAADLIAHLHWPQGSRVRVVCAVDNAQVLVGMPLAPAAPPYADEQKAALLADGQRVVEEAARRIVAGGAAVECTTVEARAASAIVDDATEWKADLIVMGSRGHGQIASMLLGSVSAEVVDHAPCPVLVARRPNVTRAVLGHDGSDCARKAENIVASSPIFDKVAIEVVSVASHSTAWPGGPYGGNVGAYIDPPVPIVEMDREVAEASARRLRAAGRRATASVVEGAPATELIRVAEERAADIIVVGTRGQTGLRRLVVGSVARNVMQHAHCSVLIVR